MARNRDRAAILLAAAPSGPTQRDHNRAFFSEVLSWWRTHVHYGSLRDLPMPVLYAL